MDEQWAWAMMLGAEVAASDAIKNILQARVQLRSNSSGVELDAAALDEFDQRIRHELRRWLPFVFEED